MSVRRLLVALLVVLSLPALSNGISAERPAASRDSDRDSLMEVRVAARLIPARDPWQRDHLERGSSVGLYLGDGQILSLDPSAGRAVSVTARTGSQMELSVKRRLFDSALGLVALQLDEADVERWSSSTRTTIADSFVYGNAGRPLRLISLNRNGEFDSYAVTYEGVATATALVSGFVYPALRFSGWAPDVRAGDVLFENQKVIGIVAGFNAETRSGLAIPASLLRVFLERSRTEPDSSVSRIEVSEANGTESRPVRTILRHPGLQLEELSTVAVRDYYGLASDRQGVLVTEVLPWNGADVGVRPGDVIVAVEGRPVRPDLSVADPELGLLSVRLALSSLRGVPRGSGSIALSVVRGRIRQDVQYRPGLYSPDYLTIPALHAEQPYLIVGGLVFVELSFSYAAAVGADLPPRLAYLLEQGAVTERPEGRRYVVLDRVLPLDYNRGVEAHHELVEGFAGVAVMNLRHLRELILRRVQAGEDLAFQLEGGRLVVLGRRGLEAADDEVRARHGIPYLSAGLD